MAGRHFDIYLNTDRFGTVHAADLCVLEDHLSYLQCEITYTGDYLDLDTAFALDPVALPLTSRSGLFDGGGIPALVDDYLPDEWARRVLTYVAYYRDHRKYRYNGTSDILLMIGPARIGALSIVPQGLPPVFDGGPDLAQLSLIEGAAHQLEPGLLDYRTPSALELRYLSRASTGVGGARPKALLHDENGHYLAKFNAGRDPFNNARVELACLRMAQASGIVIEDGKVVPSGNGPGRDVLLVSRFDITPSGDRRHIIYVNGLLKEQRSQKDFGGVFRYDEINRLIERISVDVDADRVQLLRRMLFNRAINNTDDHARNFSFIHTSEGYRMAPAYDLVPSLQLAGYHEAGCGENPNPPRPTEARKLGSLLSLPASRVSQVADEVISAVERWRELFEEAGVHEEDVEKVGKVIRL